MKFQMGNAFLTAVILATAAPWIVDQSHAQSGDGRDRRVVIMNDRTSEMVRLYGSRTTTGDWEENIILTPIPSGGRQVINFDDGTGSCLFDLRAIFRDNLSAHGWNFNVCTEQYWRVVD